MRNSAADKENSFKLKHGIGYDETFPLKDHIEDCVYTINSSAADPTPTGKAFKMLRSLLIAGILGLWQQSAAAQTTQPDDDAAKLYLRAANALGHDDARNIMSPAASNLTFRGYPPMSDEWVQMEKQDYEAHGQVREMVRQATSLTHATWPPFDRQKLAYLNECRNVANEIGDAATYQSLVLKDQPAAFESGGDLMHLAALLKNQPGENLLRLLVAEGIQSLATHRLMVIVSGATITEDAGDIHDLPLSTAKDWIVRLQDHRDAQTELDQAMKGEPAGSATCSTASAFPGLSIRSLGTGLGDRTGSW